MALLLAQRLKIDGKFENHVDENNVRMFMDKVKKFRQQRTIKIAPSIVSAPIKIISL